MRKKSVLFIAAVLLTVGAAGANTVWNPAGNPDPNAIVDGASNWNIVANWNGGTGKYPGIADTDTTDAKAVFNVTDAPECQVTDEQSVGTLSMGDNGPASPQNSVLRIMNGGILNITAGGWSAVGYSRDATMIVEEGALVNWGAHLYLGMESGGVGRLIIDGGTMLVADTFRYGRVDGAEGYVDLNSGLFQARYLNGTGPFGGLMNIKFGKYRLTGGEDSDRNYLQRDIDNGYVVGFGGLGTLNLAQEANGDWYVTANSPMNPFPAYGAVIPDGSVELSWTNMAPITEGDPVYVDVWFGTDPQSLAILPGLDGVADATSVTVDVPVVDVPPTTYYWKVNSYVDGTTGDANMVEGDLFKFDVTNDFAPTVQIDTPDTVTWANEPVQLDATVFDSGDSPVHIEWTSSDASTVFTDPATGLEDPTVEDPIVVVGNAAGNVTLTATVWDEFNPEKNSATMLLAVYANACQATRVGAGMAAQYPMDTNGDCAVNIADLAIVANSWMTDYALQQAIVIP